MTRNCTGDCCCNATQTRSNYRYLQLGHFDSLLPCSNKCVVRTKLVMSGTLRVWKWSCTIPFVFNAFGRTHIFNLIQRWNLVWTGKDNSNAKRSIRLSEVSIRECLFSPESQTRRVNFCVHPAGNAELRRFSEIPNRKSRVEVPSHHNVALMHASVTYTPILSWSHFGLMATSWDRNDRACSIMLPSKLRLDYVKLRFLCEICYWSNVPYLLKFTYPTLSDKIVVQGLPLL